MLEYVVLKHFKIFTNYDILTIEELHMKSIKAITTELNTSSRTLRYYEEIGLIKSKKVNNQRFYDEEEINKIKIIISLRKINLSLSEIKELLKNFNEETFNKVLKDKITNYQNIILQNTKELYVLNQVQKMVKDGVIINEAINEQLNTVINQDIIRVKIIDEFVQSALKNDYEYLKSLVHEKVDIIKLLSLFELIKLLNNKDYKYQILNYLNYFNNHILLKLELDKTYIIRFVFDYNNIIIGIWLDAINF